MPDLISIANDLKTAPDQWLVSEAQRPSGATPPYLVLAELQRRQLLRSGNKGQPPTSSVSEDTVASTLKQIAPPAPQGPPPPPGMAPASKAMPSGTPGGPMPGAQPPQNMRPPQAMAEGGMVDVGEVDEDYLRDMQIPDLITYYSKKFDIDPRITHAIAKNESNYNPRAVGPDTGKGRGRAVGTMQLMAGTARDLGVDRNDRVQNVKGGVLYTKQMFDMFNGDFKKTLAAYNAGPGAVKKYRGVPPYRQTQEYVAKGEKSFAQNWLGPPKPGDRDPNRSSRRKLIKTDWSVSKPTTTERPFIPPPGRTESLPQGKFTVLDEEGLERTPEGTLPAPTVAPSAGLTAAMQSPEIAPPLVNPDGSIVTPSGDAARAATSAPAASTPAETAESEELTEARERLVETRKTLKEREAEGGTDRIRSSVETVLGPRPDYSELELAIRELQDQAQRSMEPSIGGVLRNMGLALLASQSPDFGSALGQAGLYTSQAAEKQRLEARQNYINALKAGVDLQDKKNSYNEKVAELTLSERRLHHQDVAGLRRDVTQAERDVIGAKRRFDKATADADKPGSQPEQLLEAAILKAAEEDGVELPKGRKAALRDLPPATREKAVTYNAQFGAQRVIQTQQGVAEKAMDEGGLDLASEQYLQTRTLPASARSNPILAGKIMNDAARKAKERGLDSTALIMEQNAAKAYQGALAPMRRLYEQTEAFSGVLQRNMKMLDEEAGKLKDLGAPWLNMPLREVEQKYGGNVNVPAYRAVLQTVRAETARILNSATASGVITDTARKEMEHSMPDGLSYNQMKNVLRVFTQEVEGRKASYQASLEDITRHTVVRGPAGELPKGDGKTLDESSARKFFEAAGGDPNKARQLAAENGWKVP